MRAGERVENLYTHMFDYNPNELTLAQALSEIETLDGDIYYVRSDKFTLYPNNKVIQRIYYTINK